MCVCGETAVRLGRKGVGGETCALNESGLYVSLYALHDGAVRDHMKVKRILQIMRHDRARLVNREENNEEKKEDHPPMWLVCVAMLCVLCGHFCGPV